MSVRNKIDTSIPLSCAKRQAKEGTVFDIIRKVIAENGNEMKYDDLLKWLTDNWKPEKAETYGPGYIRAYVTGGIKEDYITQDPSLRAEYSFRPKGGAKAAKKETSQVAAPAPKAKAEVTSPKAAGASRTRNDFLQYLREAGNFATFEDSSEATITIADVAAGMGELESTIRGFAVFSEEDGLIKISEEGYLFFTREGFKKTKVTEPA